MYDTILIDYSQNIWFVTEPTNVSGYEPTDAPKCSELCARQAAHALLPHDEDAEILWFCDEHLQSETADWPRYERVTS